jgi:hypothetical protein
VLQWRVRFTKRLLDSGQKWHKPLRCSLLVLRRDGILSTNKCVGECFGSLLEFAFVVIAAKDVG